MPAPLRLIHLLFLLAGPLLTFQSYAADTGTAPALFDRIWNSNTLYENPDNPSLQSFSLVGRYHGQYWSVDADQGKADDWENRRIIFGFQGKLYQDFKLEFQIHANADFSPVYDELYVGFLEWAPKDRNISAQLGRLDYLFAGLERSTSSKKMATFERSALVNQLMPGEVFGLYSKLGFEGGFAQVGLFTGANTEEFGDFDSGTAATVGVAYELPLFFDTGQLHLDYLFNDGDERNTGFRPYEDVFTLWHLGQRGPWTLGVDFSAGIDSTEGRSNVAGFTLLPTLNVAENMLLGGDRMQLALRYHYASSDEPNGLLTPGRYESEVANGEGDRYQSFYAGLNYLLYGHRLKLMAGAEYAEMDDSANDGGNYSGWTYLAGLRFYF